MRDGGDVSVVADRVAFIEKTPRVRVATFSDNDTDFRKGRGGPKGAGGPMGLCLRTNFVGFALVRGPGLMPSFWRWASMALIPFRCLDICGYNRKNCCGNMAIPVKTYDI